MDDSSDDAGTGAGTGTTAGIFLPGARKRVKLSLVKQQQPREIHWRNPAQAKIYNLRLINSLRNLTIDGNGSKSQSPSSSSSSSSITTTKTAQSSSVGTKLPPSRAIKEAADSALAMTARGQTRWSRAILSRRWQMRKIVIAKPKVMKKWRRVEKEGGGGGGGRGGEEKKKKVKAKLKFLGHLVPGCTKASMVDLLEETADYVAALELQVRTMKALSDALSSASNATTPPTLPPPFSS